MKPRLRPTRRQPALRASRRLAYEVLEDRRLFASDLNPSVVAQLNGASSNASALIANVVTPITSQQLANRLSRGGVVDLPAGVFLVDRPLLNQIDNHSLTLRGAGPGLTILRLTGDLNQPLFSFKNVSAGITISGITIDGAKHQADAIYLSGVSNAQFERVEFREFVGRAIAAQQLTHSVFDACQFVQCGDGARERAVVQLGATDPADAATSTHDVNFMACRFEANRCVSLLLGRGTHDTTIFSSKFHGMLPTPAPFDHLQINGGYHNTIVASNFVRGGKSAILLNDSWGNTIRLNQIAKNKAFGIRLVDSSLNTLTDNQFAPLPLLDNGLGDWSINAHSPRNAVTGQEPFAAAMRTSLDWENLLTGANNLGGISPSALAITPSDEPQNITAQLSALVQRGGNITLPAGVFLVDHSLGKILAGTRLSLSGAGMGKTILRLTGDISAPLFDVRGNDRTLYNWLSVKDITFDGGGYQADCFRLERLMMGNFTNVEFRNFRGAAINGVELWDTDFRNCEFVQCGQVSRNRAAIILDAFDPRDAYTNSNNINFIECSFDRNNFVSLDLRNQAAKVKALASQFVATPHTAEMFPQVRMTDNPSANVFLANVFYNVGRAAIALGNSRGDVLAGNLFNQTVPAPPVITPLPVVIPPPVVVIPPVVPPPVIAPPPVVVLPPVVQPPVFIPPVVAPPVVAPPVVVTDEPNPPVMAPPVEVPPVVIAPPYQTPPDTSTTTPTSDVPLLPVIAPLPIVLTGDDGIADLENTPTPEAPPSGELLGEPETLASGSGGATSAIDPTVDDFDNEPIVADEETVLALLALLANAPLTKDTLTAAKEMPLPATIFDAPLSPLPTAVAQDTPSLAVPSLPLLNTVPPPNAVVAGIVDDHDALCAALASMLGQRLLRRSLYDINEPMELSDLISNVQPIDAVFAAWDGSDSVETMLL